MEDIKKQYKEKEDLCKEQNVEIEKQKQKYDELQVIIEQTNTNVSNQSLPWLRSK